MKIKKDILIDESMLDKENEEFNLAVEYASHTNLSIYLTGKAGSGKTTFLKYLRQISKKELIVLAPTGVAAINAGGQTIHSFFQIAPSIYYPEDERLSYYSKNGDPTIFDNFKFSSEKISIIRSLEMLVIDEVSMVRADLLDVIDAILRAYRNSSLPFGGVQLLLIGDMFQLPPVVPEDEREILSQFYETEFFFSSRSLNSTKLVYIELKKIYRQNDISFINLLNRIRVNQMIPSDFTLLHSKVNYDYSNASYENYVMLATTNAKVASVNEERLSELDTPSTTYEATITGDFPERDMPTDINLVLKAGAQVMFIKNDKDKRFYNGKIGVIKKLDKKIVKVEIINSYKERIILDVEREVWEKVKYSWNKKEKKIESEVTGQFEQFPLKLAWAITVHKSQGLTFENVIADLNNSFSPGQVYVALSRCVSFDGLVLSSEITPRSIFTDSRVMDFAKKELPLSVLSERLQTERADYYYSLAIKSFHNLDSDTCIEYLNHAVKYRDELGGETFSRFSRVWLKRFMTLISRINELVKENRALKKKIQKLESDKNLFVIPKSKESHVNSNHKDLQPEVHSDKDQSSSSATHSKHKRKHKKKNKASKRIQ